MARFTYHPCLVVSTIFLGKEKTQKPIRVNESQGTSSESNINNKPMGRGHSDENIGQKNSGEPKSSQTRAKVDLKDKR